MIGPSDSCLALVIHPDYQGFLFQGSSFLSHRHHPRVEEAHLSGRSTLLLLLHTEIEGLQVSISGQLGLSRDDRLLFRLLLESFS